MGQLTGAWASVRAFWVKLSKQMKILLVAGVVTLIVVAGTILVLKNAPKDYVKLFSGLDTAEGMAIAQILTDAGINSRLENGDLFLPADQENVMRLKLAGMGYPKSTFAYPFLTENITMFSTESERREWYKIQSQERLIANLQIIDGVQAAVVNLDIPEQKDYVLNKNQKPPTASVTLSLVPNYVMTQEQILGIEYLILRTVSGLTSENITIIDNMGRQLNGDKINKSSESSEEEIESKRLEYKRKLENYARDEVLNVLQGIYGINGVSASVFATLNYDKLISEEMQYGPSVGDNGMIAHQDQTQITGQATTPEGVVGSDPNAEIPTYPTETETSGQEYSENTQSTSYLVNSLKTQSQKDGYEITKLNVSVAVNNPDLDDVERADLIRAVAMAAGTDEASVSVIGREFLPQTDTGETPLIEGITTEQIILYSSIAGGVVLLIITALIIALVLSARRRKREQQAAEEERAIREREAQQQLEELMRARAEEYGEGTIREEEEEERPPDVHDKISDFSEINPEIAASMLKMWIRT